MAVRPSCLANTLTQTLRLRPTRPAAVGIALVDAADHFIDTVHLPSTALTLHLVRTA